MLELEQWNQQFEEQKKLEAKKAKELEQSKEITLFQKKMQQVEKDKNGDFYKLQKSLEQSLRVEKDFKEKLQVVQN